MKYAIIIFSILFSVPVFSQTTKREFVKDEKGAKVSRTVYDTPVSVEALEAELISIDAQIEALQQAIDERRKLAEQIKAELSSSQKRTAPQAPKKKN